MMDMLIKLYLNHSISIWTLISDIDIDILMYGNIYITLYPVNAFTYNVPITLLISTVNF